MISTMSLATDDFIVKAIALSVATAATNLPLASDLTNAPAAIVAAEMPRAKPLIDMISTTSSDLGALAKKPIAISPAPQKTTLPEPSNLTAL